MAHSTLHFSLGTALGTMMLVRTVLGRLTGREDLALLCGRWLVACYALGVLGIVPNLFRRMGVPETIVGGWWMNIFLFHPLVDQMKTGGMLIGETVILSCFILQYGILLVALRNRLYESG